MHRAKIAQPRVRMEERQRRPGSNARNPRKERENRKSNRKEKNHLTHTGLLMEGLLWCYMHSSVAMITLLTTSISRSGKPLRAPMPRFTDTLDAEAVRLLKSLNASQ